VNEPQLMVEVELNSPKRPTELVGSRGQGKTQRLFAPDAHREEGAEMVEIRLEHGADGLEHFPHARLRGEVDVLDAAHARVPDGHVLPIEHQFALGWGQRAPDESATVLVFQGAFGCHGIM
jgi:hypothetical protein